jgi:hypothetical protein
MTIPLLFVGAAVAYLWWTASPASDLPVIRRGPSADYPPKWLPANTVNLAPKPATGIALEREQLAAIRRRLAADELLGDDLRKAFDLIGAALEPAEAK